MRRCWRSTSGASSRTATPFGLLKDPLVVDWSDMSTRLQRTDAASNLGPLLATMPVGGQVLVVNPTTWGGGEDTRELRRPRRGRSHRCQPNRAQRPAAPTRDHRGRAKILGPALSDGSQPLREDQFRGFTKYKGSAGI